MKWNQVKHGDNLDIMRELPSESIDLIYCDILYGTGRDFGDYKDLPAKRDVIEAFYRPRLQEMHRLLKETGSIYLQMDSRINHWLRCLMDDIFLFVNEIVWCYRKWAIKQRRFINSHDTILFYSTSHRHQFKSQMLPLTEGTLKRWKGKRKTTYFKNGNRIQTVLDVNSDGAFMPDWWLFPLLNSQANERTDYPTQKPEALLERIIKASSNEGDVVADFFCGSGTTPAVAKRLNRQYFACDISEHAIEITQERLERTEPERQQELFVNDAVGMDNNEMKQTSNPPRQVGMFH